MRIQKICAAAIGALGGGFSCLLPGLSAIAHPSAIASPTQLGPTELAQVNHADSACYLHSSDGREYNLSALCGGFGGGFGGGLAQEVVLQTGDVQVTLRWNTADDLDLFVEDPFGDRVSYFTPAIPSGGLLDVDANAACAERMAAPVENIFWPTDGGVPGNYTVTVELFSYCGAEAPIDFTLTTLVQGQVQTQTGTVSAGQPEVSFPFSFPATGSATGAQGQPTPPGG